MIIIYCGNTERDIANKYALALNFESTNVSGVKISHLDFNSMHFQSEVNLREVYKVAHRARFSRFHVERSVFRRVQLFCLEPLEIRDG